MSADRSPDTSTPSSRTSTPARFTSNTETLEDALKTQTVGLVHLSEFKKRRAELAEQRDREAAEGLHAAITPRTGSGNTSRESSAAPEKSKKKRKVGVAKGKLSFGMEEEEGEDSGLPDTAPKKKAKSATPGEGGDEGEKKEGGDEKGEKAPPKRKYNPKLGVPPPKALTKGTLLREAQEREMLRREFLQLQEKIKNEEITIPFVFYDGTNVPPPEGEGVTVKKGDAVWLFLERARRLSGRREWLRVSVDDLLLVRGEVILPHHYEFYYFIANRTEGPNGVLFDYPSPLDPANAGASADGSKPETVHNGKEDPTITKVVDRRWYERNKHIFPASIWTEFDPNVDYKGMVRRDVGGNAFFFG